MGPEEHDRALKKEALKKLRQARQPIIQAAAARLKEQRRALDALQAELQGGERTVPELAAATGLASADVMWYIAALKKYGQVLEGDKDGSYFRYRLAANDPAEA